MVPKEFTQASSDNLQYSDSVPWHQKGDDAYDYWDNDVSDNQLHANKKSNASHTITLRHISTTCPDAEKRLQFLRDMENARNQLLLFRQEMNGLATQISCISEDLHESKNRVYEIEQDLTETQEDNVNLQVLLERAVKHQKESDVFATQTIRNIHSDLNLMVLENSQLQERLSSIEYMQKEHKGNVHETVSRLREYVYMLEQAQDTIQLMQEPITKQHQPSLIQDSDLSSSSISLSTMQDLGLDSRRTSETSSYVADEEEERIKILARKESQTIDQPPPPPSPSPSPPPPPRSTKPSSFIISHPRIVHKRTSFPAFLPSPIFPPQKKDLAFIQPLSYPHSGDHQYRHQPKNIRKPQPLEQQQRSKRHHPSNPLSSKSQQGLLLLLND